MPFSFSSQGAIFGCILLGNVREECVFSVECVTQVTQSTPRKWLEMCSSDQNKWMGCPQPLHHPWPPGDAFFVVLSEWYQSVKSLKLAGTFWKVWKMFIENQQLDAV